MSTEFADLIQKFFLFHIANQGPLFVCCCFSSQMPAFLWTCLGKHDFPIPSAIFWFSNCQKCFYPNTWALFNYLVRLISWGSSRADLFLFVNPYVVENSLRWQSLFPGYLWEKCNLLYSFEVFFLFRFFPCLLILLAFISSRYFTVTWHLKNFSLFLLARFQECSQHFQNASHLMIDPRVTKSQIQTVGF